MVQYDEIEISPSDKVYEFVMEKLMSGEWAPGTKISSEHHLAAELGVSRISVREALEKLAAFGLLVKKKGSGTVVSEVRPAALLGQLVPMLTLGDTDIQTIAEYRLHVEPGYLHMLVAKGDPQIVKDLRACYEQMIQVPPDDELAYTYDFLFHDLIAKGTGNPIVMTITEILQSILKYNVKRIHHIVGPDNAIYYHKAIIEAIERKDSELAALLMKRHLEEALRQLQGI